MWRFNDDFVLFGPHWNEHVIKEKIANINDTNSLTMYM